MNDLEGLIAKEQPSPSSSPPESPDIMCQKCGKQAAEIFQVTGDFCLQCWQSETHPDIEVKAEES
jgi:hypothetical protein